MIKAPILRFNSFKDTKYLEQLISNLLNEGKKITYGIVQPRDFEPNGNIMVRSQDYAYGWVQLNKYFRIAEDVDIPYLRSRIKKGDILITTVGGNVGKLAVVPDFLDEANISRSVARISIDSIKANTSYIKFYLEKKIKWLVYRNQVGGAQPVLNLKDISQFKALIPESINEQQKIADFLSSVDKKIEQLTLKKELLEKYKTGMMQKLFPKAGEQHPELRFKDENGQDFPDWRIQKIGDIFYERKERGQDTAELLSVTLKDGVKKRSEIEGKDNSSSDKSNYKFVKQNDIAYNSMRMWQGASGVVKCEGIVSPAYTVLKRTHMCDSDFFGYYFKCAHMISKFRRNSQGLTSDTWNLKYPLLSRIKLSYPSLNEQIKVSKFIQSLDQKISVQESYLLKAQTFKKGLLQQMFV